jgi:hypothetical protein
MSNKHIHDCRAKPALARCILLGRGLYPCGSPAPRIDSIDISEVVVALPEAEGKELVERELRALHSLRYISECSPACRKKALGKDRYQDDQEFWSPVRDSLSAVKIVDYLVKIKGEG